MFMERTELRDFYNDGFGWTCRHCQNDSEPSDSIEKARLLNEGESEGKNPFLSNRGLAKWVDPAQTTLICPRCGIIESASKF